MSDLFAYALLGTGPLVIFVAYRLTPQYHLRRMARVPIAELADDQRGKIRGTVRALDETLRSPLAGQPCVYFHVEARDRHRTQARGGAPGPIVLRELQSVPFVLEDDSGRAIVEPDGATIQDVWSGTVGNGRRFDAARVAALLDRNNIGAARLDDLYFVESFIPVGETLDVIGAGTREPDPDGAGDGYRTTPTRVRLAHTPRSPLWLMKPRRT